MRLLPLSLFSGLLLLVSLSAATAQTIAGCESRVETDPARKVFTCEGGLVIEADAAARMGFYLPDGDAPLASVSLDAGAALVELPPSRKTFQIRTPHAIASVRGTIFAVDVGSESSAVFVERGKVAVGRRDGSDVVTLDEGEGVDVAPGKPLTVKDWGAPRIGELMRRFGR